MKKIIRNIGIALGLALVIGATYYVYTAPYTRIAGVRIGGTLTPPPADWNTVNGRGVGWIKTGGFPPFVVHMIYSTDEGGIITATRPDGGYWAKRARVAPNGYIRVGDETFAMTATEIFGEAKIPYLESYGSNNNMPMRYDFAEEVIRGQNEPLYTWEVFYWTPR